ncbi:MAG: type II toxin-antitoxin system VapC family toxin [Spirochaetes bacterium]|nr:type II toxin-antitoxin system VapC family toxin [Spirochaetota bacterium]
MRFWDSSALMPLLIREAETDRRKAQLRDDPRMTVWWACRLECSSALNRLRRDGGLDEDSLARALGALETLADSWHEVQPTSELRDRAMRLLRVHPLRAADSAQLAAALIATSENPSLLPLLTADDRLREAARKEGFAVD